MTKYLLPLLLANTLFFPAIAWAGPQEDIIEGLKTGKSALVEQALLQGADPNAIVDFGTYQERLLPWASRWGNLKLVTLLLEKGAQPDSASPVNDQKTALMLAAEYGHLPVAQLLLQKGADPNATTFQGSVLMYAALSQSANAPALLKLILEKRNERKTPQVMELQIKDLLPLTQKGHLEVLKTLPSLKIDLNAASPDGTTFLLEAVRYGQTETIAWLISQGASVQVKNKNREGVLTYLTGAPDEKVEGVLKVLYPQGPTPSVALAEMWLLEGAKPVPASFVKARMDMEKDLKQVDLEGNTLLILAAQSQATQSLVYLLERGVDVNATNKAGQTALSLVLSNTLTERIFQIAQILLKHKANPNFKTAEGESSIEWVLSRTLLFFHGDKGYDNSEEVTLALRIFQAMVQAGLEIKQPYAKNKMVMDTLIDNLNENFVNQAPGFESFLSKHPYPNTQNQHLAVIHSLIEQGIKLDYKNTITMGNLMCACSQLYDDPVAQKLLGLLKKQGVNPNTPARQGESALPLNCAISANHIAAVNFLLDWGASPKGGKSKAEYQIPLHLAAYSGQKDIILKLLQKGANVNQLDENNRTALFQAAYFNHVEVVKLLLQKGINANQKDKEGKTALSEAEAIGATESMELLKAAGVKH